MEESIANSCPGFGVAGRRARAASGRGRRAERRRPAQGRVVRLRRPGRARRGGGAVPAPGSAAA